MCTSLYGMSVSWYWYLKCLEAMNAAQKSSALYNALWRKGGLQHFYHKNWNNKFFWNFNRSDQKIHIYLYLLKLWQVALQLKNLKCDQTKKNQNVTKVNNSNIKNSKTQNVTNLKMWQNLKSQNVTKLINLKVTKFKNSNCFKT